MNAAALLGPTPFVSYAYAYPHKSAYRPLAAPVPLDEAWGPERRDALFLYLHIPFCEYRCGFCNLFTQTGFAAELPARYLRQLRREAERVRQALGAARFARLAIGGGTPTFLSEGELADLLSVAADVTGAEPQRIPVSVEASPATATPHKLHLLREFGVDRLSLGVQTFDDAESRRLGRPQQARSAHQALAAARAAGFPTLNIDLIYGSVGQTLDGWLASVRTALAYRPEELYLYPLYVRPLTGLGRQVEPWPDVRLTFYRHARTLLREAGYQQVSLRMFRAPHAPEQNGPVWCCQSDGMVGLGCGARSYTAGLHYSSEFAVGRAGVQAILAAYLARDAAWFDAAHYGIALDEDEQRRRFVILSLLPCDGLSRADYARRFGEDILAHFPALRELESADLADIDPERIRLTAAGVEYSDAIGPWLGSGAVRRRMEEFECR